MKTQLTVFEKHGDTDIIAVVPFGEEILEASQLQVILARTPDRVPPIPGDKILEDKEISQEERGIVMRMLQHLREVTAQGQSTSSN